MAENQPLMGGVLSSIYVRMDETIRDGHNKALLNDLAPTQRVETLSRMQWSIEAVSGPLILPDCVAIGVNKNGDVAPYILQDGDELVSVAMPLTTNRLLVGKVDAANEFPTVLFNLRAVASSENFFVSSVVTEQLIEWSRHIGVEPRTVFHKGMSEAFSQFDMMKTTNETPSAEAVSANQPVTGAPGWMVHFLGCADEETAKKIVASVSGIVSELGKRIPVNRIDGITFAQDYPAALRDLDRGFATSKPLATTTEEGVEGAAMAPLVLREGIVKTHIVMRGDMGHALISEDEAWRNIGCQMLVAELVETACTEIFDTALPGVLLKPITSVFNAQRFDCVNFAWSSYISSRLSASISRDSGNWYRDFLIKALGRATREIPEIRYAYRFHGDVPKLMEATYERIKPILSHAAKLIGHYDGLSESYFDNEGLLETALQSGGLRQWFDSYQQDLQRIWTRLGEWESFDEFVALGGHVERFLWQFGIVLWEDDKGVCRVEVPLTTDYGRLVAHIQANPDGGSQGLQS